MIHATRQLFSIYLILNNNPRFEQMELFFFFFFLFCHTRHSTNSGLLPALSISVQLLVCLLKVSSCDLSSPPAAALRPNKVLIQSVIFTVLCLEVGEDPLCVMFVVSAAGRQNDSSFLVHGVHSPIYFVFMHSM